MGFSPTPPSAQVSPNPSPSRVTLPQAIPTAAPLQLCDSHACFYLGFNPRAGGAASRIIPSSYQAECPVPHVYYLGGTILKFNVGKRSEAQTIFCSQKSLLLKYVSRAPGCPVGPVSRAPGSRGSSARELRVLRRSPHPCLGVVWGLPEAIPLPAPPPRTSSKIKKSFEKKYIFRISTSQLGGRGILYHVIPYFVSR